MKNKFIEEFKKLNLPLLMSYLENKINMKLYKSEW